MPVTEEIEMARRLLKWADNPDGITEVAQMQGILSIANSLLALAIIAQGDS